MSYEMSKIESEDIRGTSPYINYGSNQVLKINRIELKVSQNTGSPKAILHMETKPISTPGFSPLDGAKGQVGKVACGIYMKEDKQKKEFLEKLKRISEVLDLREEINKISAETFEDVVEKISKLISGKYARYTIFGEEYPKEGGKIGVKLALPRFNFVAREDSDGSTLEQFDKDNKFHYKKLPENTEEESSVDDLPF